MRAYVVSETTPIFPFRRAGSSFLVGDETVGVRLRRQLHQAGLEIIEGQSLGAVEGPGCVLQDNLVLADEAVQTLIGQLRGLTVGQSLQWSVEASLMRTVLYEAPAKVVRLPVWLLGAGIFAHPVPEPVASQLQVTSLFDVHVTFPPQVFGLSEVRVPALSQFALAIERWPDVLNASTLIARELAAKLYGFFSKFLPAAFLRWAVRAPRLIRYFNRVGRRCRIHPSAVLEACIIGDDVEIGPHAYLRAAVIGSGTVIREGSNLHGVIIGPKSYILRCDMTNAYVGARSMVATSVFLNSVLGNECFIGGGTGFADYVSAHRDIDLRLPGGLESSEQRFLGSGVGDNCFIGAGLVFGPGEAIPSGSKVLNASLISRVPPEFDQVFAVSRGSVTRIPASFVNPVKGTA